jgi:hypothetical protein
MFNWACDIDIYRVWAELLVQNKTQFEFSRKAHCCYASRRDGKNYIHSHDEIVNKFHKFIVHHEPIAGVLSVALGNYGYIFRSENQDDILEMTNFIQATRQ